MELKTKTTMGFVVGVFVYLLAEMETLPKDKHCLDSKSYSWE